MNAPDRPEAMALLCDAAHVAGDKLYILGGGWRYIWAPQPDTPTPMALAIHLSIPWSLTNRRLDLDVRLLTEDGEQVRQEFGDVRATGQIEAGRPPGAREGFPIAIPFVLQYPVLTLAYGGYAWQVEVDGDVLVRVPFQVSQPPGMPLTQQEVA